MGLLADSKSRSKISKDPNNTKWLRDTSTFGQKILRAQGWEPGLFLGAQDAAHSELHTAANASYIRVSMKDDMRGLGFDKAKEDVVTGLDVFSDLLSRLNGRSEEAVADERQARLVMKTNKYVEQKWGPMRFVRGGLLVGDDMKEMKPSEDISTTPNKTADDEMTSGSSKKERKSKKRKASDFDEKDVETDSKKGGKRRKEERKAKMVSAESTTDEAEDTTPTDDKKERRRRKKSKDRPSSGKNTKDELAKTDSTDAGSEKKFRKSKSKDKKSPSADESESKEDKKSKRSKKEKKETRKREKGGAGLAEPKPSESSEQEEAPSSAAATGASTPAGSATGTSTPRGSRNFVRSRFIAAKRQAMLDTKALNQIFMVKT
ncbi:Protein PXR1 [Tolypocladium capitatum]|uniref:PinX1-related protein 1 n=1 Tax=Tolypocladium capitatum TaxID=45235 RepID=A0A2K3Q877_9HYPO|nr:Protein PXR1 [Tolypocladium capitatum]